MMWPNHKRSCYRLVTVYNYANNNIDKDTICHMRMPSIHGYVFENQTKVVLQNQNSILSPPNWIG